MEENKKKNIAIIAYRISPMVAISFQKEMMHFAQGKFKLQIAQQNLSLLFVQWQM